ncbi:MAG: hypothetical protein K2M73_11610 [Lachnospiraceae bacterium]|nr:hypothetical protein [Lachnospiraceae bacterium]
MLKKFNRILGGMITGTSFYVDKNNEQIYSVSFKRADNREMTVSVDRQYYDRCVHGNLAIFDIDVVMENDGDINHYDKKLSRAKRVAFVGVDTDINTYKERMTEDLIWLSRYAKPLKGNDSKKSKRPPWMILIGLVFIIGGILLIASVPIKIFAQISDGKRYADFIYTEGEVIDQDWSMSTTNHDNDDIYYDIKVKIQYEADGNEYVITEKINNQRYSIVLVEQDMIYNQSNPSEAYLASYDVIAKRYIPDGCDSWVSYILLFVILLVMGIICTGVGIMVTFGR